MNSTLSGEDITVSKVKERPAASSRCRMKSDSTEAR